MIFCKDCCYYKEGNCHVLEFNMVTGERAAKDNALSAHMERNNNTPGHCGFEGKLFKSGTLADRPVKKAPAKKKTTRKPKAKK